VFSCEYKDLYSQVKAIQVHCIIQHIVFVISLSLPLGVHFFCVAKRNRTKDKYAGAYLKRGATPTGVKYMDVFHTKATLSALFPKTKLFSGRGRKLIRSIHATQPSGAYGVQQVPDKFVANSQTLVHLIPPNSLIFGSDKMGQRVRLSISLSFNKIPMDALDAKPSTGRTE
jgi:hypothetical protein